VIAMKTSVFKMSQGVLQRSSAMRVIYAIQEDLVKDLDNLPFRSDPTFITGTTFNQTKYESSFDDEESQQACYDKDGIPMEYTTEPRCAFRLSYYRVLEVDRNYTGAAAGTFSDIPLSRLVMRAIYIDSGTKTSRTLYLSRLKTHVLHY
jgi:hypothetical protein